MLALLTAAFAKFLIFSRTTEMPRSSEALSSRTRDFISSGLRTEVSIRVALAAHALKPLLTRTAAVPMRELSTSFPSPVGHRRAYAEAARDCQLILSQHRHLSSPLTLLDMSVFRSTLTVCSCAATSSIVFGRLEQGSN